MIEVHWLIPLFLGIGVFLLGVVFGVIIMALMAVMKSDGMDQEEDHSFPEAVDYKNFTSDCHDCSYPITIIRKIKNGTNKRT